MRQGIVSVKIQFIKLFGEVKRMSKDNFLETASDSAKYVYCGKSTKKFKIESNVQTYLNGEPIDDGVYEIKNGDYIEYDKLILKVSPL